ncbi:MAG: glycosyltransferase family 2 protein, partial [Lachnospiraceae bacterium]|nr:glycosyltransferase family 2 protein [Lachnospiraceae bacterium]
MEKREVDVIIPTFRPDEGLITLLELLEQQTLSPVRIIIIDTEDDNSRLFFEKQQLTKRFSLVELYHISPEQFDHGKTRD